MKIIMIYQIKNFKIIQFMKNYNLLINKEVLKEY